MDKKKVILLLLIYCLTACVSNKSVKRTLTDPILDNDLQLRRSAFIKSKDKRDTKELNLIGSLDTPKLSHIIIPAKPNQIGNGQLVSFAITEQVALKDVFLELARLTDIDIQLDPTINSNIILKISNKPVETVIHTICEMSNLKYTYNNNILVIERDEAYLKDYNVDILASHDLWGTIEEGIKNILKIEEDRTNKILAKLTDETNKINQTQLKESALDGSTETAEKLTAETITFSTQINKPAGIISVYANYKGQKAVENYINKAKKNYGLQVLIEAKVVEVKLNDDFTGGINWNVAFGDFKMKNAINIIEDGIISLNTKNLNLAISALQSFGTTRTLSSPRISTLNNQTANLNFIQKLVYFSVEATTETVTRNGVEEDKVTYNATKQEDEEGVKLEITPTINPDTKEVTLNVKPELRVKVGIAIDPTVVGTVQNEVPIIQTRNLETSLKLNSGNVMVIGGLMSETTDNNKNGIFFLQNIPIFGWLFKNTSEKKTVTETVIFIKATVINQESPLYERDDNFYNTFTSEQYDFLEKE